MIHPFWVTQIGSVNTGYFFLNSAIYSLFKRIHLHQNL